MFGSFLTFASTWEIAAISAVVRGPAELEATTIDVVEVFFPWNGVVRPEAFWLGLEAGRKAELFDLVTLVSEGMVLAVTGMATSQTIIINQRNFTEKRAIASNMLIYPQSLILLV
jgi:hypothetical protein